MLAKCTVCYGEKTVTDDSTGEVICRKCGIVVAEDIEVSSGKRAFSKEEFESRSQTGAPTSLARHDMGLSTIIGRIDKDASGRRINADMRAIMDRLRTWDYRTQAGTPTDRNLMFASNEFDKLKHKLALTDAVIEKAAYIYRKAQQRRLVRGRTMVSLVAASLYAACREHDMQRTLKDIADASNIKVKDLSRSYRLLLNEFDLKIPLADPVRSVTKIANRLGFSERTARDASRAMEEIKQQGGSAGKDPMGLAAATLYLMCIKNNEMVSQKSLAYAAGVTEVTIRNRSKELKEKHYKLFGT
jgi:transcription initiation factor TFIIB